MRARCNAEYRKDYERYGGRGIKVCNEWEGDFVPFRDWALSNGYKEGLEIERVDNDGDYEPSNCAWVTRKEQVRNRSNSVNLTYKGKTLPLIEWCEFYGVKYRTAYGRYKKGWRFERIFNLTYSDRGNRSDRTGSVELIGKTE